MNKRSLDKVYPHNIDILSVIYGNLLGSGYIESRLNSARIVLCLDHPNAQYIYWLKNFFFERGYCSNDDVKFRKLILKKGKFCLSTKIRIFSFGSLNFIYNSFYIGRVKVLPFNIEQFLTPLALAVWFMGYGFHYSSGLAIVTDLFERIDLERLQTFLFNKYSLKTKLNFHIRPSCLYFSDIESIKFISIIESHLHKSMLYKINL